MVLMYLIGAMLVGKEYTGHSYHNWYASETFYSTELASPVSANLNAGTTPRLVTMPQHTTVGLICSLTQ